MRRTHKNPMEINAFEGTRMRFGRKKLNFTALDNFFRSEMRIQSQKCILGSKMQKTCLQKRCQSIGIPCSLRIGPPKYENGPKSARWHPKITFQASSTPKT